MSISPRVSQTISSYDCASIASIIIENLKRRQSAHAIAFRSFVSRRRRRRRHRHSRRRRVSRSVGFTRRHTRARAHTADPPARRRASSPFLAPASVDTLPSPQKPVSSAASERIAAVIVVAVALSFTTDRWVRAYARARARAHAFKAPFNLQSLAMPSKEAIGRRASFVFVLFVSHFDRTRRRNA